MKIITSWRFLVTLKVPLAIYDTLHFNVLCFASLKVITVDTCPLTEFEGGLILLHEVDDDIVIWLESTATAALAK